MFLSFLQYVQIFFKPFFTHGLKPKTFLVIFKSHQESFPIGPVFVDHFNYDWPFLPDEKHSFHKGKNVYEFPLSFDLIFPPLETVDSKLLNDANYDIAEAENGLSTQFCIEHAVVLIFQRKVDLEGVVEIPAIGENHLFLVWFPYPNILLLLNFDSYLGLLYKYLLQYRLRKKWNQLFGL